MQRWTQVDVPDEALRFAGTEGFLSLESFDGPLESDGARPDKRKKKRGRVDRPGDGSGSAADMPSPAADEPDQSAPQLSGPKKRTRQKKKKKKRAKTTEEEPPVGAVEAAASAIAELVPASATGAHASSGGSSWDRFGLHESLVAALLARGFTSPTPIQAESLPATLHGHRDVIGAAETGSGKTLAFGLPILHRLAELRDAGTPPRGLFALVVTPTRELALQIASHLRALVDSTNVVTLVGGMSVEKQQRLLRARPPVVIATPGRLWELISEHSLGYLQRLRHLRFFVLDEVDRMVEAGHYRELGHLLGLLAKAGRDGDDEASGDGDDGGGGHAEAPAEARRQTLLFSATLMLPAAAREAHAKRLKRHRPLPEGSTLDTLLRSVVFLNKTKVVDLSRAELVASQLTQTKVGALPNEKDAILYLLLRSRPGRVIVFCNAISAVSRLRATLQLLGVDLCALQGSMQQRARLKAVDRFRSSERCVLLATDVAARGIDVPGVDYVVHYQLPRSAEVYVHRSGRTARAALSGLSVALVEPADQKAYRRLCFEMGNADGLPELELPLAMLPKAQELVSIARQIDKSVHRERRDGANERWKQRIVDELELPSESEEEIDDDVASSRRAQSRRDEAQVSQLRRKLAELLKRYDRPLRGVPMHEIAAKPQVW